MLRDESEKLGSKLASSEDSRGSWWKMCAADWCRRAAEAGSSDSAAASLARLICCARVKLTDVGSRVEEADGLVNS